MDQLKVYYIKADLHPEWSYVVSFSVWSYTDTEKRKRTNNHRIKTFPISSDVDSWNDYWYRNALKDTLHEAYTYMTSIIDRYSEYLGERNYHGVCIFHGNRAEITINKGGYNDK